MVPNARYYAKMEANTVLCWGEVLKKLEGAWEEGQLHVYAGIYAFNSPVHHNPR
jgi:hypothetical protein